MRLVKIDSSALTLRNAHVWTDNLLWSWRRLIKKKMCLIRTLSLLTYHGKESESMGFISNGELNMASCPGRRVRRGWWRCDFGWILNKSGLVPTGPAHRGSR